MDYVKLVKDGVYKKEDLSEVHQSFIDGMEHISKQLENFFDESDFNGMEFSPTIAKIQKEIADAVVEEVRSLIEFEVCEAIVCFGDKEASDSDDSI